MLEALGVGTLSSGGAEVSGGARGYGADDPRDVHGESYDVVIVGAGYAGVTAARELGAHGLRTVLLEARDRIGGRIWTETWAGESIELGGEWVRSTQPYVTAELQRYGIKTTAGGVQFDRAFYPTPDGPKQFAPDAADTHMGTLLAKLFDGSQQYFERPYDPLYRRDLLASVDPLSLRDRIDALGLPAQDELWLSGVTASYAGGSSAWGGLTGMAQWWALGGGTPQGWDRLTVCRPEGGMTRLLIAMLAESGAKLWLNSPVSAVEDDGAGIAVTTSAGAIVRGQAVIVAVPVNVWRTIHFSPGLPEPHSNATAQGVDVPNATKLWLRLSSGSGRTFAQGAEGSPVSLLLPQATLPDGDQLVVAFSESATMDFRNRGQVQAAIQKIAPGVSVIDIVSQEWGRDPYSLGGWGLRRPGQLLSLLPGIQQPYGRIAFSTADIASGWYGAFIDGAIQSGKQAAEQALTLLG